MLELTPASQGHRCPPMSRSKTWVVSGYGTDPSESQNEAQVQQTWPQGVLDAAQMVMKYM